jgi:predicted O-methyltransferase YrrM
MSGKTTFHWLMYRLGFHEPHTQTTKKERLLIEAYSKGKQVAVEIGVYEGRTTAILASSVAKAGKVVAVDPFFSGKLGISYGKMITFHYLRRNRLISKVQFLEMFSYEAAQLFKEEIDFLFVDGDHSYEGISRDWQDWSVKLKPGGYVALHDTSIPDHDPNVSRLGSYKYYNEVIKQDDRFDWITAVDSLNILQRKANI